MLKKEGKTVQKKRKILKNENKNFKKTRTRAKQREKGKQKDTDVYVSWSFVRKLCSQLICDLHLLFSIDNLLLRYVRKAPK